MQCNVLNFDQTYFTINREKQARKGFRPPSAMKGMGYFQNLRNFLDISENFWGIF